MDTTTSLAFDAAFYAIAFFLGSIGGTLATFVTRDKQSGWDILASGCLGGFIGTCSVAYLAGSLVGSGELVPRYLAIAGLIGCTGKGALLIAYKVRDSFIGVKNNV